MKNISESKSLLVLKNIAFIVDHLKNRGFNDDFRKVIREITDRITLVIGYPQSLIADDIPLDSWESLWNDITTKLEEFRVNIIDPAESEFDNSELKRLLITLVGYIKPLFEE